MRRRRLWPIGLGIALLVACVGVWKWSERPSYRFLKDATLEYETINVGGQWLFTTYRMPRKLDDALTAAEPELLKAGWSKGQSASMSTSDQGSWVLVLATFTQGSQELTLSPLAHDRFGKPLPNEVSQAQFRRPATWVDRARVFLQKIWP